MKKPVRIKFEEMSKWIYCSILFSSLFLLNSCADKNDYRFNTDYVKELYDKTFPVKNIDPEQNWKTTSLVRMNVSVYEDNLETYKIKVYDNFPYNEEEPANRLAMGTIENGKTLELSFDAPLVKDTLYVSRVDRSNRRLVQMVVVNDRNSISNVVFGTAPSRAYSYNIGTGVVITNRSEPYTEAQISSMLSTALEVESWKAIGVSYGIISKTGVYKLTKDGASYKFSFNGSDRKCVLIVTTNWTPSEPVNVGGNNLTIVIANGGSFSGTMNISNSSNLIVLKGGRIEGANTKIYISNASNGMINYNGGDIDINSIVINGGNGEFYNASNLILDLYNATDAGTVLVNKGYCSIGRIDALNGNIENGCYMETPGDFSVTKLAMGNQTMLKCNSLNMNQWGSMSAIIGQNSMIDCATKMKTHLAIQGSGFNNSLVRIRGIQTDYLDSRHYYKDVTVECGDATTEIAARKQLTKLCKSVAIIGESSVIVPAGNCTGNGNSPGTGGDTDVESSSTYTYCYEDYYPIPGDYDFNDIVMDVSYNLIKKKNKIIKVEIPVKLVAVGATYSIGAALQLINIPKSNIKSVTVTNGDLNFGTIFATQVIESDKNSFAVIPLFNDAHHAISGQVANRYMYNTAKGHENYVDASPRDMTVTIEFITPIDYFGLDNMDLFIARPIINGYYEGQQDKTRVEVHLREFWGYRTANGANFENNEAIAGNRTWAIAAPNFKYPYERVPIFKIPGTDTNANSGYPYFQQWASDRNQAKDWYLRPNPGSTYR